MELQKNLKHFKFWKYFYWKHKATLASVYLVYMEFHQFARLFLAPGSEANFARLNSQSAWIEFK